MRFLRRYGLRPLKSQEGLSICKTMKYETATSYEPGISWVTRSKRFRYRFVRPLRPSKLSIESRESSQSGPHMGDAASVFFLPERRRRSYSGRGGRNCRTRSVEIPSISTKPWMKSTKSFLASRGPLSLKICLMVKRRARLSKRAQSWLEREIRYLASRSPAAAKRLAMRIRDARTLLTGASEERSSRANPGNAALRHSAVHTHSKTEGRNNRNCCDRHATQQDDAYAPEELLERRVASPLLDEFR